MARIFKVPFAAQGDTDTIPTETQGDGSVSLTQGFGYDYEREYEDPAAKDIRREAMNGLFHDVTEAIGDIQLTGIAKWSADAAPYPAGATVWHNDATWLSLVGNNSVEPVLGPNWTTQLDPRLFMRSANNLSDLSNVSTARANLGLGNSATQNVGTGAGTVAAGNDSRITGAAQKSANLSDLSNATTARSNLGLSTVSQSEAEAGTGSTTRAWTAQRVRQAVAAWWNGVSGAFGRTLVSRTNASQVRDDLGLGSAATRNVGTSSGNVMEVGAFGIGGIASDLPGNTLNYPVGSIAPGLYKFDSSTAGSPSPNSNNGSVLVTRRASQGGEVQLLMGDGAGARIYTRSRTAGDWSEWSEIYQSAFFTGSNQQIGRSAGYQPLPGGIILQWGTAQVDGDSGATTLNLPVAFPTGGLSSNASRRAQDFQDITRLAFSTDVSRTQLTIAPATEASGINTVQWMALGY